MIVKKIVIDGVTYYKEVEGHEKLIDLAKEELFSCENINGESEEKEQKRIEDMNEDELEEYLDELDDKLDECEEKIDTLEDELEDLKDELEDLEDDDSNDGSNEKRISFLKNEINNKKCEIHNEKEFLRFFKKEYENGKAYKKNFKNNSVHIDVNLDNDPNSRKIYAMLPFLGKERIAYIAKEKINGNTKFKNVKLVALLPFMNKEDINEIFENALKDESYKDEIISFAPFVSKEALDKLCDEYCAGNYQYIDINRFYPFMSSSSISKLFDYFVTKD